MTLYSAETHDKNKIESIEACFGLDEWANEWKKDYDYAILPSKWDDYSVKDVLWDMTVLYK